MTRKQLSNKLFIWAAHIGVKPNEVTLDNATMLLSQDVESNGLTWTGLAVYGLAVHTVRTHAFVFTVQTTWRTNAQGDLVNVINERYKLLISF